MRYTVRLILALCLCASFSLAQKPNKKAKNVILFLADAGGLPTLNAASRHGYDDVRKLYIQSMPHIALSDTSPASNWVTDSAAGMTAIVTGVKTHNGVISQGPDTVRGEKDGTNLKTILEYAEENGLSTGVVSNVSIADATPAACYAHANARGKQGEIFLQVFTPRYGDGVDVVLGHGRKGIYEQVTKLGKNLDEVAAAKQRPIHTSLDQVTPDNRRPIVVMNEGIDIPAATHMALDRLSKNKKGYFLMVEWDTHTDNPRKGLDNFVNFDKLIREVAAKVDLRETLIIFTADHSFDLRITGGKRGQPLVEGYEAWAKANEPKAEVKTAGLRVGHSHTGENIVSAAQGPGAHLVKGFMLNTDMFNVMMNAYGWKPGDKQKR